MKIQILDPAKDDLAEGFWFYESQETGLGHYFLDSILPRSMRWKIARAFTRSTTLHIFKCSRTSFHFSIYYRVDEETMFVEAVIDQRRDPEWITERLN